jgi:hypothetical protein
MRSQTVGAELNAELAKESAKGSLQQKEDSNTNILDRAA